MLYLTYIHSKRDGLLYLAIEEKLNKVFAFNPEDELVFNIGLDDDPSNIPSEALIEFMTILQRVAKKDIAVVPAPEYFTWVDTEPAYGPTVRKIHLGYGWLYPNNNTYVFLSNDFNSSFANRQLPVRVEGATIVSYKKTSCTYKVDDNEGYSYVVPYFILEYESYTQNPLTHFLPFKLELHLKTEGIEWEDIEDCTLKIYTKTKSIGNSLYVYIKDSNNMIFSTVVNYAVLRKMIPQVRDLKLEKSLIRLSAPGPYLTHISKILKHIGVK